MTSRSTAGMRNCAVPCPCKHDIYPLVWWVCFILKIWFCYSSWGCIHLSRIHNHFKAAVSIYSMASWISNSSTPSVSFSLPESVLNNGWLHCLVSLAKWLTTFAICTWNDVALYSVILHLPLLHHLEQLQSQLNVFFPWLQSHSNVWGYCKYIMCATNLLTAIGL